MFNLLDNNEFLILFRSNRTMDTIHRISICNAGINVNQIYSLFMNKEESDKYIEELHDEILLLRMQVHWLEDVVAELILQNIEDELFTFNKN